MGRSILYDYPKDELQKVLNKSNSYAEVLETLGMSKHGGNYNTLRKVIYELELDTSQIDKNREQFNKDVLKRVRNAINYEDVLNGKTQDKEINSDRLKKYLIDNGYKEYKCEICGLSEWLGKPIPLQLHHKDGNHKNNRLENIGLLCPNCHSTTDTFAGRNIKLKNSNNNKEKKDNQKIRKIHKVRRRMIGWNEDHTRFYDGISSDYKVICPVCNKNIKSRSSKMCAECRREYESTPKVEYEKLLELWEKYHTNIGIARELNYGDETILKWLRYYKIK